MEGIKSVASRFDQRIYSKDSHCGHSSQEEQRSPHGCRVGASPPISYLVPRLKGRRESTAWALLSGCPGEEGDDLSQSVFPPCRGGQWLLWTLRGVLFLVFQTLLTDSYPESLWEKHGGGVGWY